MPINKNWSRWIKSSVRKYFNDNKEAETVLFFEGDDRATDRTPAYIEVRMDGPRIKEPSKNYFLLNVYINLLATAAMSSTDAYVFERISGTAESMLVPCIPVMKYGNGPDDDRTQQIGVLTLKMSKPLDQVRSAKFGQVDEVVRELQGTVEGRYQMDLTGD